MPDLESLKIPKPKNAKDGDEYFDTVSVVSKGQNLINEPPAELVELPSHGYLYKEATSDPEILQKGGLRIRPMTIHEEKILSTPRLVKSGQALDMIFRNVIKSQIDPANLLSSDRVFIMLWLRNISYGNIYKFQIQCQNPNCQRKFEWEVDLNNHPIKEFDNPEISEPFELLLPVSKHKILFRLPRGTDEIEIIKMQNQPKKMNDTDDSIVRRLSSAVLKVIRPDGSELPPNQKEMFIESLIARDASIFRNKLEELDCGIEDIKGIACPYCENTFDSVIPITESFFRTTD